MKRSMLTIAIALVALVGAAVLPLAADNTAPQAPPAAPAGKIKTLLLTGGKVHNGVKIGDVLQTATLVPITSSAHGAPTEVELGVEDGLKGPCCANLANVQTVRQQDLSRLVGSVRPEKMSEICRALAVAVGCD